MTEMINLSLTRYNEIAAACEIDPVLQIRF